MFVFALNIIVGFACAVGVDMGFNSDHHHDVAAEITHQHFHHAGASHHHNEDAMAHHSKDSKDNCCKDKVIKIAQTDKVLPQSVASANAVFFTVFLSSFYNIDILTTSQTKPDTTYFVRSHHPPIPDIRIAIQSFQI